MPGRGTRHHAIRIPDELWSAAIEKAKRREERLNEIIRQALERYVREDEKEVDQ